MASPKLTSNIKRECLFTISPHRQCFWESEELAHTNSSRLPCTPGAAPSNSVALKERAQGRTTAFGRNQGTIERNTFRTGEAVGRRGCDRERPIHNRTYSTCSFNPYCPLKTL